MGSDPGKPHRSWPYLESTGKMLPIKRTASKDGITKFKFCLSNGPIQSGPQSVATALNVIDRFHSRDKNLDNRCYATILVYRNVN